MVNVIWFVVAVVVGGGGYLWRRRAVKALVGVEKPTKSQKHARMYSTIVMVIGIYLLITRVITLIFGPSQTAFTVNLWPARVHLLGMNLSMTVVDSWIAMAILLIIAIIFRLTVVRHLKDRVTGAQNVLEIMVEAVEKYTTNTGGKVGEIMASYIFTVAAFLVCCAFLELFGMRPPSADITLTFALAIITFVLINWYGVKRKGIGGRVKSLASPTPAIFLFRIISDLAFPISLSCRLFGNMFGGMIVMDLVYSALGNAATGIPSVIGLYFDVFHPLIQAFIFVTLTLAFIKEAIE